METISRNSAVFALDPMVPLMNATSPCCAGPSHRRSTARTIASERCAGSSDSTPASTCAGSAGSSTLWAKSSSLPLKK
ncbi:hypothetical protein [Arthrobacter sp. NA-172]|uniref:hypothetical protein n=1 Tax=Arthrobacter sp. NA-172 TaxID=3367524 RepID=UPI00375415EC